MPSEPVVIIGAGPAGLAAGHALVLKGMKPLILEQSGRIGGIARTESYKGFHFDIGGHRFFSKDPVVTRLWEEMLGDRFLSVARLSRIYYRGRYFNYPLNAINALRNLGLLESLLIFLSYLWARLKPLATEDTFEEWVANRFGWRLYQTFFKTYTEKVWGISCREIRADWAAQRIKGLSLMTAVANALFGRQTVKSLIDEFSYPVLGPGMMWERFRDFIVQGGGTFRLHQPVRAIHHRDGLVTGLVCGEDGREQEIATPHLVSSMPIPALVRLLQPAAPEPVLAAAAGLSYRAFLIVVLIIDREELFRDQWIYVHSPDVEVGRIQNFKNWSSAMVPDRRLTSLGMEYFCNEGDGLWNMDDAMLRQLATRELAALGLAAATEVIDGYVVRQASAYPVYDGQYARHLATIRKYLAGFANLQTIGRSGMHRYNNMDHSMQTGRLAAENILGAGHDIWEVNEEKAYHEEDRQAAELLIRSFARMDKLAFATATGTVCGLLVFAATLWIINRGGDVQGSHLRLLSQYFIGYSVTVKGAFVAFTYSFGWGFLFGWLFAYLRNFLLAVYLYRLKRKIEMLTLQDFFDNF